MSDRPEPSPARGVVRGVAWLTVASVAVKPLWFAFLTVACARVLGAEGYGQFNTALSLTSLAFALTGWGIHQYTVREVAADRARAPRFVVNFVALRVGLGAVAFGGALAAGVALGYEAALLAAVAMAGLYQAANGLTTYAHAFFQAFERLELQAVATVAEKVLVTALGGAGLLLAATATGTLAGMAGGMALVAAGTYAWGVRRVAPFRWAALDPAFLRGALRGMVPIGLATVLGTFFFRVDNVMVEAVLGLQAAGEYGLAFRIVEALNLLPGILVYAAAYPRLARLHARGDAAGSHRTVGATAVGLLVVGVPIAATLSAVAVPLIGWVAADPSLAAAGPLLALLAWAFPLTSVRAVLYTTLLAQNDERFVAVALALGVALNVALNAALLPALGARGAVLATLASEAVLLTAYLVRYLTRRPAAA